MTLKSPKNLTGIGRQLMSLLLLMVVSLTLLASPALAANSVMLTNDNYYEEVLYAKKPVVVILASKTSLENFGTSLEELKTKADNYFDDKFKVLVGNVEEDLDISNEIRTPKIVPIPTTISVLKNGTVVQTELFRYPKKDSAETWESMNKEILESIKGLAEYSLERL